jgi:hypothetical protein
MKWKIALLVWPLLVMACQGNEMEDSLSKAGGAAVVFFGEQGEGTDIFGPENKVVETMEKSAISKLASFVAAKELSPKNCSPDGTIFFVYDPKTSMRVDFHLSDSCRYFSFNLDGKNHQTQMSNEARDFLYALKRGQAVY